MAEIAGRLGWFRRREIVVGSQRSHYRDRSRHSPGFFGVSDIGNDQSRRGPDSDYAGMPICQVVFHEASDANALNQSSFNGRRKPNLGVITVDLILEKLMRPS